MATQNYTLRTAERTFTRVGPDVLASAGDVTTVAASSSPLGVRVDGANLAVLLPFGTGNSPENKTFNFSVFGVSTDNTGSAFYPVYIAKFKATLGSTTGLAGAPDAAADNSDFFADKIELVDGDTSCRIVSAENNTIASVHVDLAGASRLLVTFSDVGTPPTSYNCLFGTI